jgi:hypothetical protein
MELSSSVFPDCVTGAVEAEAVCADGGGGTGGVRAWPAEEPWE